MRVGVACRTAGGLVDSRAMDIDYARAGDRAELLDFLYGVFLRANPNHPRFEDLFTELFDGTDEAMGRHAVVRVGGRIAACVGMYRMTLRIAGCDVPLAGIGQVSTGAEHLGKGYMSALLREQLARARAEGAAVAWLGGRHDRYSRFGFESAGLYFVYGLDARSTREIPLARHVARLDGNPADGLPEVVHALRERGGEIIAEPRETYLRRLRRTRYEAWTATPSGASEPDAWALFAPEKNRIDELAGSVDGCLEIVATLARQSPGDVTVSRSTADRALSEGLRRACHWVSAGMNMLSVLDRDRLLDAYAPLVPPGTRLPPRDLSPGELARVCFGPELSSFPVRFPFNLPDHFHI